MIGIKAASTYGLFAVEYLIYTKTKMGNNGWIQYIDEIISHTRTKTHFAYIHKAIRKEMGARKVLFIPSSDFGLFIGISVTEIAYLTKETNPVFLIEIFSCSSYSHIIFIYINIILEWVTELAKRQINYTHAKKKQRKSHRHPQIAYIREWEYWCHSIT